VVSGLPNITPTFSRSWLMNMQVVFDLERSGQLAERLAHEPRLKPDRDVPHLALELGARHERRHRVDDDDVDGAAAHEHVADLEGLLAGVGLADEHVVDVDTKARCVRGVHRVLRVDERRDTSEVLGLGDDLECERRLAAGLGAVDLHDTTARDAADAEGSVEREGTGGDRGHRADVGVLAETHERALAELLLHLLLGDVEHLVDLLAVHRRPSSFSATATRATVPHLYTNTCSVSTGPRGPKSRTERRRSERLVVRTLGSERARVHGDRPH
jgi:hypothetical protein